LFSSSLVRSAILSIFKSIYLYSEQEKMPNWYCKVVSTFPIFRCFWYFRPLVVIGPSVLPFVFSPFLLPVFPFSFFAKNQMRLTLKIVAQ